MPKSSFPPLLISGGKCKAKRDRPEPPSPITEAKLNQAKFAIILYSENSDDL